MVNDTFHRSQCWSWSWCFQCFANSFPVIPSFSLNLANALVFNVVSSSYDFLIFHSDHLLISNKLIDVHQTLKRLRLKKTIISVYWILTTGGSLSDYHCGKVYRIKWVTFSLSCTWSDLDFEQQTVTVQAKDGWHTKNYKSRTLQMTPVLYRVLMDPNTSRKSLVTRTNMYSPTRAGG